MRGFEERRRERGTHVYSYMIPLRTAAFAGLCLVSASCGPATEAPSGIEEPAARPSASAEAASLPAVLQPEASAGEPARLPAEPVRRTAERGVQVSHFLVGDSPVWAFWLDEDLFEMKVVVSDEGAPEYSGKVAERLDAALVVNGSFFDEDGRPMGLLISEGAQRAPLRRADWGVLYRDSDALRLVHSRDYAPAQPVMEAIEAGPRLVVEGRALRFRPGAARRTAIGYTVDGRRVVVATEGALELSQLAQAMIDLGCSFALNLDGGPSTQLSARMGPESVDVPGLYPVPVSVAFIRRGGAQERPATVEPENE